MSVISLPVRTDPLRTALPPEPPLSDEQLICAVLQGDGRAAAALYDQLRPAIDYALRRVLLGRHRDYDDLMQTTFERVLKGLVQGRFEARSSLRTWAAAIAGHVALDALRAGFREERRTVLLPEGVELPSTTKPEARLEAASELRRVQSLLSRMKPELAETLLLHDVLGHALQEIAALRGASLSATQSRLHRARLELRRRAGHAPNRGEP